MTGGSRDPNPGPRSHGGSCPSLRGDMRRGGEVASCHPGQGQGEAGERLCPQP